MAELINKNLLMEELHSMLEGDADLRKDYEYMGIDDYIRSMPTTTEAEIRSKAIAEFAEALRKESFKNIDRDLWIGTILHIAKEMKGE